MMFLEKWKPEQANSISFPFEKGILFLYFLREGSNIDFM